ncbi:MAG: hypothetical protein J6D06_10550 [Clostridia bacterium]|nr:hypothetical protein [Clostridia bacterium]
MKKIITLCSLLVCLAVLVTVFTSCGDKTEDSTTAPETYVAAIENDGFSFTAEVGAKETVIKNKGEVYQTLKYPVNAGYPFDYNFAKERSQFIDMNFDGQPDFYIAVSAEAETIYYYCWLFNATTKKFEYSVSLSGLTNISVDANTHTIYSTFNYRDTTKVVSYKWVNGALVCADQYDNTSDTIPPEVTEAVSNNIIGNVPRPQQTTKPQQGGNNSAKPQSGSTTRNNAAPGTTQSSGTTNSEGGNNSSDETTGSQNQPPLNTTTTAPRSGGVEVATGDIDDGWF